MAIETETHVPAWKKLGLKLKYAKEVPEQSDDNRGGRNEEKGVNEQDESVEKADIKGKKEKKKENELMILILNHTLLTLLVVYEMSKQVFPTAPSPTTTH